MAILQQNDLVIKHIILQMQSPQPKELQRRFMVINNVLHYVTNSHQPRIYVPKALQQLYLDFYHNHPLSGHLGFHKVLQKLRLHYYWPNMRQFVSQHLPQCAVC